MGLTEIPQLRNWVLTISLTRTLTLLSLILMVVGCRHVVEGGDGAFCDDAMGDDAKDGHDGADDKGDHSGGNDVDGDERDLLLVVGSPNFDLYSRLVHVSC